MANPIIWVRIVEARNLPIGDRRTGSSDPYVVIRLKGHASTLYKTQVISHTLCPVWNEEFTFVSTHPTRDIIKIKICDRDRGIDNVLGQFYVPVYMYANRGFIDEWHVLKSKKDLAVGEVHIQMLYGGYPTAYGFTTVQTLPTIVAPAVQTVPALVIPAPAAPLYETKTLWAPTGYTPICTETHQVLSQVAPIPPAPPLLPQMPKGGHTAVAPLRISSPTQTYTGAVTSAPAVLCATPVAATSTTCTTTSTTEYL